MKRLICLVLVVLIILSIAVPAEEALESAGADPEIELLSNIAEQDTEAGSTDETDQPDGGPVSPNDMPASSDVGPDHDTSVAFFAANENTGETSDPEAAGDQAAVEKGIMPGARSAEDAAPAQMTDREIELMNVTEPVMTVSVSSVTLGLRESRKIDVSFSDGIERAVQFLAANGNVLTVLNDGWVCGAALGNTTLRVSSDIGYRDIPVCVRKAPARVYLSEYSISLGVGEVYCLEAQCDEEAESAITWTSDDPDIVEITETGELRAISEGSASICASAFNGKTAAAEVNVLKAPEYVIIPKEIQLTEGQILTITPELSAGSAGACAWTSSDTKTVTVDEAGQICGLAVGSAVITAETYNHHTSDCLVTVAAAPQQSETESSHMVLGIGERIRMPITWAEGTVSDITYASSDSECADIDSEGWISAKKKGTCRITATTYNGNHAYADIKVVSAPSSLYLSAYSITLGEGQQYKLDASTSSGNLRTMTYESDAADIAAVSSDGMITAGKTGDARICVSTYNGKKAYCDVHVEKAPARVDLNILQLEMGVGMTCAIKASAGSEAFACTFASDNPEAACVDENTGEVTAMSAGTAVITAKAYNGVSAQCTIDVLPAPTQIIVQKGEANMMIGETTAMPIQRIDPAGCYDIVSYVSSDPNIAAVDQDGIITAIRSGQTKVYAYAYNGVYAEYSVNVVRAPGNITVDQSTLMMTLNSTYVPKVTSDNGAPCYYTLSSSDVGIVSIESDGKTLRANAVGEATITVTAYNGISTVITVSVLKAPETIALSDARISLDIGGQYQLRPIFEDGAFEVAVTFSSSNSAVASVSAEGIVTALSAGTCIITATTANGLTAECKVVVGKYIADISHYNTITDFDLFANNVSFVILRATCGMAKDTKFATYATELNKRGVPFGVYCYGKAQSVEDAYNEADLLYSTASAYNPRFYVYDAETDYLTADYIKAFTARMRTKNVPKVGIYCAHHRYSAYGLSNYRNIFDFIWIPRYGKNDGTLENSTKPAYACDLWQYTSSGSVPGISGRVDLNLVTGTGRSLAWFTAR